MDRTPAHVEEVQTFNQAGTLLIDIFIDDESVRAEAEKTSVLGGGSGVAAEDLASKAVWDVLKQVDGAIGPSTDTEVTIHSELSVTL
jgi:hypothetical protein